MAIYLLSHHSHFPNVILLPRKLILSRKNVNVKSDDVRTNSMLILEKSLQFVICCIREDRLVDSVNAVQRNFFYSQIESVCNIEGNAKDQKLSK